MIFKQFLDPLSSNFTYILAREKGSEALIIDPVLEKVDEYIEFLNSNQLKLVKAFDTHIHADHITGLGELRNQTLCMTMIGAEANTSRVSQKFKDNDIIKIKDLELKVIATPGHTKESYCFYTEGMIFTGDTLFIRGNGRTDFQGGNAGDLYDSITKKLFTLPDNTAVWPGHDYKDENVSSIGTEKFANPRVSGKTKEEFIIIMDGLNLPYPKRMDEAVPANQSFGDDVYDGIEDNQIISLNEAIETHKEGHTLMVDLRSEVEIKEEGTIQNSLNVPYNLLDEVLKDENHPLTSKLIAQERIYFFCAHGERSSLAVKKLTQMGYDKVSSMSFDIKDWF